LGLMDKCFLAMTPATESNSLQMKMLCGYDVDGDSDHVEYQLLSTNQITYNSEYDKKLQLYKHKPKLPDQFRIDDLKKRGMSATPRSDDLLSCLELTMQLPHRHFTDTNAILVGDLNGRTRVVCYTENPQLTVKLCEHHKMYKSRPDQVRKLSVAGSGHYDFDKLKTTRASVNYAPEYVQRREKMEELVRERTLSEKQVVRLICSKGTSFLPSPFALASQL